ncbi:potassium channel subfamily K member 15 [Hermetia illucens]|uniref:potassium channel subfamily K member 15 n=1 Tax=Hermetia illucens TaxID=343691 RepID=UPI0018CC025D|nr:potassium channel subfamily K member 15 [Hermetia illucens]XP_037918282.1 potassium channel subfamily K member 15 [Hermetia illucens]XP_037918283.1 potassium channel subfamily K member 15 [Hermetia illucens]
MTLKRSVRRRQKPPFAQRAKDQCRKFTAFMFSNVGIIMLVVIYTIAGSFMFIAIEGKEAMVRTEKSNKEKNLLALKLWNISCCVSNVFNESSYRNLVDREILAFQRKIVKQAQKGSGSGENPWSFPGAFLYSLTVITTIGYGNISPRTSLGKITTILYAIIGMPLFLLYLSNIGDVMAKSFKWIYAKVCLCRICPGVAKRRLLRERRKTLEMIRRQELEDLSSSSGISRSSSTKISGESTTGTNFTDVDIDVEAVIQAEPHTVIVPLTTCVMIMIGYILCGATLFSRWEAWGVLDGSYFCFISLTSIGFGDIVPGTQVLRNSKESIVEVSFILCAVYLLLGMALIAMCFNLMQEQVIHKLRSIKRIIRRCFRCDKCRKTSTTDSSF